MKFSLKRINFRHLIPDVALVALSFYLSLLLRVGWDVEYLRILHKSILLFIVLKIGTFYCLGIYDIIWRYVSSRDILKLTRAVGLSSLVVVAATYIVDIGRLPRATFFIDGLLTLIFISGFRILRRLAYDNKFGSKRNSDGRLTLVYGAGGNGRTLATRIMTDGALGFRIVGFMDDNPQFHQKMVGGVRVLGGINELAEVVKKYRVQEIVVAIANPPATLLRRMVQETAQHNVRLRVVPSLSRSNDAQFRSESFRRIELSDLLGRSERDVDVSSVEGLIKDKRVLVTGAGGSIGSELARQILSYGPSRLILLDHSEFNLYRINEELRAVPGGAELIAPVLADIKDSAVLKQVFETYTPEVVFHAAAYKHVHLVESNPFASILNNIQGTSNLLDAAEASNVQSFILISTDKAVNPAGVMGATKRVCELLVSRRGLKLGRVYASVRFGNVLGSSGSLIPLLENQIQNNRPMTITHPDMTRYFMLIPEAVSLVLKAATIGKPGDICILRMGEPVRIVDVARSLAALMGRTEEECPIVFTGLRPGEKLYEELYLSGKELRTEDPDVLILPKGDADQDWSELDGVLMEKVSKMVRCAQEGSQEALLELSALVRSTYVPPTVEGSNQRIHLLFGGNPSASDRRPS